MKLKKFMATAAASLIAATGVCSLAACGGDSGNYDFTIWCYQTDSSVRNYAENPVFKELEKRTGKKVKFILDIDYNNLVATKSYPEVILWLGYQGTNYGGGIADGVVKDISDLIYEYAPNYRKVITSSDQLWQIVSVDGKIPAFYVVNDGAEMPWQGYVMRKDLIEKNKNNFSTYDDWVDLGEKDSTGAALKTPVTYAHWEDIFSVMQEKEGIKYPLAMRSKGYSSFDMLSAGYDLVLASGGWYDINGTVKNGWVDDSLEDYLTLMNKWFAAQYISPNYTQSGGGDISSATAEIVGTKKAAPTSMCFYDAHNYLGARVRKGRDNGISGYDLMAVPSPRLTKDQTVHTSAQIVNSTGLSACITTKCSDEKAKEIVEWFDYLYTEEGADLMSWGLEGVTYNVVDGKRVFIDEITSSPDKGLYNYVTSNFPTFVDLKRNEQFQDSYALTAYNRWTYLDDGAYRINTTVSVASKDNADYTQKLTATQTYFEEEINKFIKGTRPMSEFTKYVAKMKEYGIEKVIEYYTTAYNEKTQSAVPDNWKVS